MVERKAWTLALVLFCITTSSACLTYDQEQALLQVEGVTNSSGLIDMFEAMCDRDLYYSNITETLLKSFVNTKLENYALVSLLEDYNLNLTLDLATVQTNLSNRINELNETSPEAQVLQDIAIILNTSDTVKTLELDVKDLKASISTNRFDINLLYDRYNNFTKQINQFSRNLTNTKGSLDVKIAGVNSNISNFQMQMYIAVGVLVATFFAFYMWSKKELLKSQSTPIVSAGMAGMKEGIEKYEKIKEKLSKEAQKLLDKPEKKGKK